MSPRGHFALDMPGRFALTVSPMATDTVTTTAGDAKNYFERGPRLYHFVKGQFVERETSLNQFVSPLGFSLREAREALTGGAKSERSEQIIRAIERELGIAIEFNRVAA